MSSEVAERRCGVEQPVHSGPKRVRATGRAGRSVKSRDASHDGWPTDDGSASDGHPGVRLERRCLDDTEVALEIDVSAAHHYPDGERLRQTRRTPRQQGGGTADGRAHAPGLVVRPRRRAVRGSEGSPSSRGMFASGDNLSATDAQVSASPASRPMAARRTRRRGSSELNGQAPKPARKASSARVRLRDPRGSRKRPRPSSRSPDGRATRPEPGRPPPLPTRRCQRSTRDRATRGGRYAGALRGPPGPRSAAEAATPVRGWATALSSTIARTSTGGAAGFVSATFPGSRRRGRRLRSTPQASPPYPGGRHRPAGGSVHDAVPTDIERCHIIRDQSVPALGKRQRRRRTSSAAPAGDGDHGAVDLDDVRVQGEPSLLGQHEGADGGV